MRIGIDGGCLSNRRGFGRFARQTLAALSAADSPHEFVVFIDKPSADSVKIPDRFERQVVEVGHAPSLAASSQGRRSILDMLAMSRSVARARLDLIYFPATYSFFPVWGVKRVVVTMHDTLALAHPDLVFPSWQGRVAWTVKEHAAARWADQIWTVSQSAKHDLITWFKLPAERVRVISEGPEDVFHPLPSGPDSDRALRKFGIDPNQKYILYVGGLSPHKNLPRLIEAFAQSGLAARGINLVLVGDTSDVFHTHVPALREAVAHSSLGDTVVFTGFVPDDDLAFIYNRAIALVHPSLMEGFGLPPVEAMACGTPVLASNAGSLPEIISDAGILFDPTNIKAISAAIRHVVDNPSIRADLAVRSLNRAACFTWAAAAHAMLEGFDELDPNPQTFRPSRAWSKSA